MLEFPYIFQARLLRQIVLSGSIDHVARRVDDSELKTPEDKAKWRHAYRYSLEVFYWYKWLVISGSIYLLSQEDFLQKLLLGNEYLCYNL